jgi:hypothetical protein
MATDTGGVENGGAGLKVTLGLTRAARDFQGTDVGDQFPYLKAAE